MSKTFQCWDWNQICLFTLAHIHLLYRTRVREHDWWLKELPMLSGQFYFSVSLQFKYQCTWHGTTGGSGCGNLSFITFSFLLFCQRRSRLAFTECALTEIILKPATTYESPLLGASQLFTATPSQISPWQPAGALVTTLLWEPVVFSERKLATLFLEI